MLDFMRRRTRSVGVKILFGIIALVFIFWGVGGQDEGQAIDAIATVDDRPILARDFQRAYENVQAAYRNIYKENWSSELVQALNLKDQTLQQLIDMRLMAAEARRIGMTVSDDEVRTSIAELPAFQAYGSFSPERYRQVLRTFRMTPREFEDDQRTQLLTEKFRDFVLSTVQVSDSELQDVFASRQDKVNLRFVKIASTTLFDEVVIETDDLQDFYETHRESFRQPERVRFLYLAYPDDHFSPDVAVSAQDIEAVYQRDKDTRFVTPERVRARHILLSLDPDASEEEKTVVRMAAIALLEQVRDGADFAALAQEHSDDTPTGAKGGDLGFFSRGAMVKPFEDAAFSLSVGEVSEPVETQLGFHIIQLEDRQPAQPRPFDEVRDEIRQELTTRHSQERARQAAREDRQQLGADASLADLAEARGLQLVESPWVGRDETLPDLGRQPQLLSAAFNTELKQVSAPVEVDGTTYLVLPHERRPSQIPDFSKVQDEAEGRYKTEQAEALARQKAEGWLARVLHDKSLDALAGEEALEIEETGEFTRQGSYVPKIGSLPALKKAAFRLADEDPIAPAVYVWGGNAFVAELVEYIPASTVEFEREKDSLRQELTDRKRTEAGQAFLQYLKKHATVEMNQAALLRIS